MNRSRYIFSICFLLTASNLFADEFWQSALSKMPLKLDASELNRTNCIPLILDSFQSNNVVKAVVFMPGATDELYFFKRAHATLTNANPTLLDAISALTNQTYIRVDFRSPLLLLHTSEDSLDDFETIKNQSTAKKLSGKIVAEKFVFNDADWEKITSTLKKQIDVGFRPYTDDSETWHFYRHSFATCGVTQLEMLEAIAHAGKTTFTLNWLTVEFQPDARAGTVPQLKRFPLN